jgi:DMSO/TMAO reductase YedYZ molybdopterin-dependent catalytic subunit
MSEDLTDEAAYESSRYELSRRYEFSRRELFRASAGMVGLGAALLGGPARQAVAVAQAADEGPIVKPLPEDLFTVFGSNAETRWESMRGQGYHTPIDRFFVRDHTRTPRVDPGTWRLRLYGTGLHGSPTADRPVEFTYEDLLGLPAETHSAFIECAGNGRSFYTTQQGQTVSGTAWKLGAVGVARWRGVRLATVLERAGLTRKAVDVLPIGLDPDFVDQGVNHGPVRRPLPIAKALKDVLLAYEMNGETLPLDHGFPVRVVVPNWVGIASIKWLGAIEVSDGPLFSPWNTRYYRLFGPEYPADGSPPLTRQVTKSAFELPWGAELTPGRRSLSGRSWSGNGRIQHVDVSVDGGATWRRADLRGPHLGRGWQPWEFSWRPTRSGPYALLARATDETGAAQPAQATFNTLGYLFGAVVRHPVTVT